MLWLSAIAPFFFIPAAWMFIDVAPTIAGVFVGIAITPVIATTLMFFFFCFTSPQNLRSEDYQIRHEALQVIQQKTGPVVLDPISLPAITNPVLKALPDNTEQS